MSATWDDLKKRPGDYERQLAPNIAAAAQLLMGPNHAANWYNGKHAIVGVNIGGKWFEIDGDYTKTFGYAPSTGTQGRMYVEGSTGNDTDSDPYIIESATLVAGKTRIVVTPPPADATVDGTIYTAEILTLPAEYELPLGETVGAAIGARGETVEWGQPAFVQPEWDIDILDYDQLVIEWLLRWKKARTYIRFFQSMEFTAIGRIARVPLKKPRPEKLTVTVALRGVRLYKMPSNHTYPMVVGVDGVTTMEIVNAPFLVNVADLTNWSNHTELYGSEVL